MRKSNEAVAWAVYRMTTSSKLVKPGGQGTVCEQAEWEEIERNSPGRHALVRENIASEQEAEALARDTSGYVPSMNSRRKFMVAAGSPLGVR